MITYRNDIDGLRAIAVSAVVLFHVGAWGFGGGYVGVDVFFVISGYLITSLIAADLERGRFSLKHFWERRIRRIWPASLALMVIVLAAGWGGMFPAHLRATANDAIAQLLMLANVRLWLKTNYFADHAEIDPLLHMWSLAVEEQFYVFLPLLMMGLWRWGRSCCVVALSAIAVGSLVASEWMVHKHPSESFFLLPFRAWEMLIGSLAAFVSVAADRWWRDMLGVSGLFVIMCSCLTYDRSTTFPGLHAAGPCLGAAALILAGMGSGSVVSQMLKAAPLVMVGRMSYSIYLWHWPMLAFLRYMLSPLLPMTVLVVFFPTLLVVGYVSWRWIELPFRAATTDPSRSRAVYTIASASLAVLGLAACISASSGIPCRFPEATLELLESEDVCTAWEGAGDAVPKPMGEAAVGTADCFLLWGDSHGMAISSVLHDEACKVGVRGSAVLLRGSLPGIVRASEGQTSPGDVETWNEKVVAWIMRHRPRHIIICGRWSNFFGPTPDGSRTPVDMPYPPTSCARWPLRQQEMRHQLNRLVAVCESVDAVLWCLLEVPYQPKSVRERVLSAYWSGRELDAKGVNRATHERRTEPFRDVFADFRSSRVHVIDLAEPFFDQEDMAIVRSGGVWLYADDDHIGPTGASLVLGPTLRRVMQAVAAECEPGDCGPAAR